MLPLAMYGTSISFSFCTNLRRMPPIEMTSSSGCGEKQIVRRCVGSLLFPRILAPSALNTSPFTAPDDVERRVRMPLQERGGNLEVDLALDGAPDDRCLVLAGGEDGDLAGFHDR